MENFSKLKARLLLEKNGLSFLGDHRVTLLEAIATHGSITSAAKAIGMSYKAAWDTVDTMNNLSDHPLVSRSTGGRHGGGTALTEHGQRLVKIFREGEKKFQGVMEDLATDRESFDHLQNIYKRFSMRTSARNQFAGKIKKISRGSVNAEIKISLDDHNEIISVITTESAELMDLEVGVEVYALIKAPSVLLTTEASTQFSAENRLCGVISQIRAGEVNAAISLVLPNEKTVTSIVTLETIRKLELAVGTPAQAIFTGSTVILARI